MNNSARHCIALAASILTFDALAQPADERILVWERDPMPLRAAPNGEVIFLERGTLPASAIVLGHTGNFVSFKDVNGKKWFVDSSDVTLSNKQQTAKPILNPNEICTPLGGMGASEGCKR